MSTFPSCEDCGFPFGPGVIGHACPTPGRVKKQAALKALLEKFGDTLWSKHVNHEALAKAARDVGLHYDRVYGFGMVPLEAWELIEPLLTPKDSP